MQHAYLISSLILFIFEQNCEMALNIVGTDFLYPCIRQVILDYCSVVNFNH